MNDCCCYAFTHTGVTCGCLPCPHAGFAEQIKEEKAKRAVSQAMMRTSKLHNVDYVDGNVAMPTDSLPDLPNLCVNCVELEAASQGLRARLALFLQVHCTAL
jgi:hypothetical protein